MGGVSETKRHYPALKMSNRGLEGGLPLIAAADPDKMVRIPEVEFNEDPGLLLRGKSGVEEYLFWTVMLLSPR